MLCRLLTWLKSCAVEHLNFTQRIAAMLHLRRGCRFDSNFLCSLLLNPTVNKLLLEMMAIKDALSLEIARLAPIVIGFNREPLRPVMHSHTKFQQNRAMHGWVIDDLTNFAATDLYSHCLRDGTKLHQIWEVTYSVGQSSALPTFFGFPICCCISKRQRLKGDCGRKSRSIFGLLHYL